MNGSAQTLMYNATMQKTHLTHLQDRQCNRSIYDFIQMMEQIEGTKWAEKVPIDLPIYNIAGDQDPVGEYGVGVYQVSNWLIQTGHTVTTKLYSGYRHEIHNYAEIKNEVEAGIIAFMDGILS